MITSALLALAATGAPAPSAAAPRAPTASWVLDFGESQCLASRSYGTAAEPLTLAIKPSPIGDLVEVILLRTGSGPRDAREIAATIRVGDRAPISTKLLVYKTGKDAPRIARATLPAAAADLRGARTLTIKAAGESDVPFALGGTDRLAAEMSRCLADLQDHWNISPARSAALKSFAKGSLQGLIRNEDYPADAVARNAQGTVAAALLIDEAGKVADCTLTQSSGAALLDAVTCIRIRQNARYTPAIGADGKPAKSAAQGRITFRIADRPSPSRIEN